MTAEETALEEFREAVKALRATRRVTRWQSRLIYGRNYFPPHPLLRTLARIIRAIRAEREERGDMLDAFGQGIRTAYETGRRDALRGVQGACLFEHARMFARTNKADPWTLDHGYMNALINLAKAAEEAAR